MEFLFLCIVFAAGISVLYTGDGTQKQKDYKTSGKSQCDLVLRK